MNTTVGGMDVGGTDAEAIIPLVTGPISLISSAIIIAMILRSKKGLSIIYHRILFGLSVVDILGAAGISAGSLVSKGTTNLWKSFGSTSTCNAQGFLAVFSFTAQPLYSCSLHIYFLCTIKYEMKTEDIQRRFEPFFHCIPILYGITGAIIALVTESINPTNSWCFIESYPRKCHINDGVLCIRGERICAQKIIFGGIPATTSLVFMTITTILLYCKARKTERNNKRHVFRPSEPHSNTNTNLDQPNGANLLCRILSKLRKLLSRQENTLNSQKVLNRMMNFYAAYLFTYVPVLIAGFTAEFGNRIDIFYILVMLFYPLQGFYTLLIVNHPKYKKVRRLDETKSAFHAFFAAIRSYGRATIGYEKANRTPGISPIPDNTGNRRNSLLTKRNSLLIRRNSLLIDPQVTANDAENFEGDHMTNEEHSVNYEEDSE